MMELRVGIDGDQPYLYLPCAASGRQQMWFMRRMPADLANGVLHGWKFTNAEEAGQVVAVAMMTSGAWVCSCGGGEDCKFIQAAKTLLRIEKPLMELMESNCKKGQPT